MKVLAVLAGAALVLAAAGCGGSSSVNVPTVQPAAVYRLVHLQPSGPVVAGKPVRVSFSIQQPDGRMLVDQVREVLADEDQVDARVRAGAGLELRQHGAVGLLDRERDAHRLPGDDGA